MKQLTVIKRLTDIDRRTGNFVFTGDDLAKICQEDSVRSFQATLTRMVRARVLERATRNVFVNTLSVNAHRGYTIEYVAKALRREAFSYLSLESALSEYGVINQCPVDRITVMTTGRKGEFKTPYGVIEFTHTERPYSEVRSSCKDVGRPLHMATWRAALRDLRRVGRNTDLILEDELEELELD